MQEQSEVLLRFDNSDAGGHHHDRRAHEPAEMRPATADARDAVDLRPPQERRQFFL